MTEEKNITLRGRNKIRTREKAIAAARLAFKTGDYHSATIRDLAKGFGMSTGAIYASFPDGKPALFEAAMGFKPPLDTALCRAAPMLCEALSQAIDGLARNSEAWVKAKEALELADTPLDGEAWERHLSAIRAGEPHDPAGQPAASPSLDDAAGA